MKIFKNVLNWENSFAALIFLREPNEWHWGKLRSFKIVEGWVMLFFLCEFFGCFIICLFLSKREVPNSYTFVCNQQVIGAAQFYCTVWCCAVFIKPTTKNNKIDCTGNRRDHHLYWRSIYLFKLLEISVTISRRWLQPPSLREGSQYPLYWMFF